MSYEISPNHHSLYPHRIQTHQMTDLNLHHTVSAQSRPVARKASVVFAETLNGGAHDLRPAQFSFNVIGDFFHLLWKNYIPDHMPLVPEANLLSSHLLRRLFGFLNRFE